MCLTPWQKINTSTGSTDIIPCGKCAKCLARRVSAWSFRLMQQEKISISAMFLTLTFSTTNVPISINGFMTLDKRELQLFFKRLRKAHGKTEQPIKYYAAGEYGGRTRRPHYHIILFNARTELVQSAWSKGDIHYGTITAASVGYTLKYINKGKWKPMHSNDDRLREFALMSKNWAPTT